MEASRSEHEAYLCSVCMSPLLSGDVPPILLVLYYSVPALALPPSFLSGRDHMFLYSLVLGYHCLCVRKESYATESTARA